MKLLSKLSLCLLFFLNFLFCANLAQAQITIDGGGSYSNLQAAIDAATDAATIIVPAGSYNPTATVVIDKPLILRGAQAGVDARSRTSVPESIVTGRIDIQAGAGNVTIDGLTLVDGTAAGTEKAALYLASGVTDVTVRNTVFSRQGTVDGDGFRGILTTSGGAHTGLVFSQNRFSGWATGIYLNPGAPDANITANAFTDNYVGMSVDGPDGTQVSSNLFSGNLFEGLGIGPGTATPALTLTGNQFTDNATHIGVYIAIDLDLATNSISGGVSVSGNPVVYGSIQDAIDAAHPGDTITATGGTYTGFQVPLSGPTDLTIAAAAAATIDADGSGPIKRIVDLRADGTVISGFTIDGGGNHVGISVTGQGVTVTGNTIRNVLTGIQTTTQYVAGNTTLSNNTISGAGYGISLQNNDNTVTGNVIGASAEGLAVGSAGNAISGNQVTMDAGGTPVKTSTTADYAALPGADIDLADTLAHNAFNRAVHIVGNDTAVFGSLQDAIDAAAANDVIRVYPGEYTEHKAYNATTLGLLIDKPVTLQGVTAAGTAIDDRQNIQATVTSTAESNWGTNFYVTAANVAITGLRFAAMAAGTDSASSPTTVNKAFEITADGFMLAHAVVTAASAYDFASATSTALYFGDEAPDDLDSFTVSGNDIHGGITITNGAGDGASVDFRITGNRFFGYYFLRVRGVVPGVAWLNSPAHIPTTVTGNDLSGVSGYLLQVWGDDADQQVDAAFVSALVANNTLGNFAYAQDANGHPGLFTYSEYGGSAPAYFMQRSIQAVVDTAADGDTVVVSTGRFPENVALPRPLTLTGSGAGTVIAPASGNAIAIQGNVHAGTGGVPGISDVTIENLAIDGATNAFGLISLSNAVPAGEYDVAGLSVDNVTINPPAGGFAVGLFDVNGATFTNVTINSFTGTTTGAFELVGVTGLTIVSSTIGGSGLSLNVFDVDGYAANGSSTIRNSRLASLKITGSGAVVDARNNFWGNAASPASKITGSALFDPWYVNAGFSQLSNFTPPVVNEPAQTTQDPVVDNQPTQDNLDVQDEIDNIVITEDTQALDTATITAIDNALKNARTLASNTKSQIAAGQVSTNSALDVLTTLEKALSLAGSASQKGAPVNPEDARSSLAGMNDILDAITGNTGSTLAPVQVDKVNTVTRQAVSSAGNLITGASGSQDVASIMADVGKLLGTSVKVSGALDPTTTQNAKALSETALQKSLARVSAEVGVDASGIDSADVQATQALLKTNKKLLNKVVDTVAVSLPSTLGIDKTKLAGTLANQGLGAAAAEKISTELSQFVNPEGVNLELGNGTRVNAKDSLAGSIGANTDIAVDNDSGAVVVNSAGASVPVKVQKVTLVPDAVPEGITILPDGSALSVANGVGIKVVPSPKDPVALVSALEGTAEVSLKPNGGITMSNGSSLFSGSFSFQSAAGGTPSGSGKATFIIPTGTDPADPDYSYSVEYPDGSRQKISPFVSDDNFFSSLETRGLDYAAGRGSGVITINSGRFRPDYFVTPLTAGDRDFLDANADASGIAYRAIQANGDGITDFQVFSPGGVQLLYGLP